ncbi:MAG: hypothetical protein LWX11_11405, partial [Firmicutes bacterium]|nr:hypothetical protein [Bacillota bacterium]
RNHLHHQLLDRLPFLRQCAVLILWLLSAGTAAGAYAQGAWRVIPWVSLLGILHLVGVFTYLTLREHRRLRENSQPSPMV